MPFAAVPPFSRANGFVLSVAAIFLFVFFGVHVFGQHTVLDSITIQEERIPLDTVKPYASSQILRLDQLGTIPGLQLLRNSASGISTVLHRGMSSKHFGVFWHGLNLSSPTNAVYDVSLLPFLLDQGMDFRPEAQSFSAGLSGMAGGLHIGEHFSKGPERSFQMAFAPNQLQVLAGSYRLQGKAASLRIGLEHADNANQFRYKALNGDIQKIDNQNQRSSHVVIDGRAQLSRALSLAMNYWYQDADRQLPTPITASALLQTQQDVNHRFHTSLRYEKSAWSLDLAFVGMEEAFTFEAPGVDSRAKIRTGSLLQKNTWKSLSFGAQWRYDRVEANFFQGLVDRSDLSFFTSYEIPGGELYRLKLDFRQHLLDGERIPAMLGLQVDRRSGHFSQELSARQVVQAPSLNDLYWPQGGNPDLLPERSMQLSYRIKYQRTGTFPLVDLQAYSYFTREFIEWSPGLRGFWEPANRKAVRSIGATLTLLDQRNLGKISLIQKLLLAYVDARVTDDVIGSNSIGKRLIYTPPFTATLDQSLHFQKWEATLTHQYMGQRFILRDNAESISPYLLGTISLGRRMDFKQHSLMLRLQVENLWNSDYEIVRFFPTPRRRLIFHIKYNF